MGRRAFVGACAAGAGALALEAWLTAPGGASSPSVAFVRARVAPYRGRLSAWGDSVAAVANDGTVLAAGNEWAGQACGWGPARSVTFGGNDEVPHPAVVMADGTVRCPGRDEEVAGWSGVGAVFPSVDTLARGLVAVDAAGRVLLPPSPSSGERGGLYDFDVSSWPPCERAYSCGLFAVGLTGEGRVVASVDDHYLSGGPSDTPAGRRLVDAVSSWEGVDDLVAMGFTPDRASVVAVSGGRLRAFPDPSSGEPGAPVVALGTDERWREPAPWALLGDGSVLAGDGAFSAGLWGDSAAGALGLSSELGPTALCRGVVDFDGVRSDGTWAALRSDGSVWLSGERLWGWDGAVAVAAGSGFCSALYGDGTVRTSPGGPDTSGWRLW